MKDYFTLINDEMRLEIDNYYNIENVDYKLKIWTSGGRYIELFLQPEIDYIGTVRNITTPDSKDDSFILHERYYQDIINAMDDLKRYYEQDQRKAEYLAEKEMQEG
jgi:hypothetical protein